MYDWFQLAATRIPTAVGVKFESYDDEEFMETCKSFGRDKVMVYAPCNSLGHWKMGVPGRGSFIQAFAGPMCHRVRQAYERGDPGGMEAAVKFISACDNAGGNFKERYFYGAFDPAADFGPPRSPQPHTDAGDVAALNATLRTCGFYEQHWP